MGLTRSRMPSRLRPGRPTRNGLLQLPTFNPRRVELGPAARNSILVPPRLLTTRINRKLPSFESVTTRASRGRV